MLNNQLLGISPERSDTNPGWQVVAGAECLGPEQRGASSHSSKGQLCQGTNGAGLTDTKQCQLSRAWLCLRAGVVLV